MDNPRKTLIITALTVASTSRCHRFGITAEFPMTLIATAVVFPIVASGLTRHGVWWITAVPIFLEEDQFIDVIDSARVA